MKAIWRYFGIDGVTTTVNREIAAGVTVFLTMAYIIFVNPSMLAETGMDKGAVFVATCLASAIGCFIMGIFARLPVALAPGMGLNAFFTYTVVLEMGKTWETALGAVFLSGCIFVLISIFKIREWVINAIPDTLKLGIVAGIGAFLAFIALKNAQIIVASPATFVTLGDVPNSVPVMVAVESANRALPILGTLPSSPSSPAFLVTPMSVPEVSNISTNKKAKITLIMLTSSALIISSFSQVGSSDGGMAIGF